MIGDEMIFDQIIGDQMNFKEKKGNRKITSTGYLRMHPLFPSAIFDRPQKLGSHRSHRSPPTPGLQVHCLVFGSQVLPYDPRRLQRHIPEKRMSHLHSMLIVNLLL